jgi:MFS family permease
MFFAPLHRRLGTRTLFMLALACFAVIYSAWPLMNSLAKRTGNINAAVIVVLAIQHVFIALMGAGYSTYFCTICTYAVAVAVTSDIIGCAHILIVSAAPARNSLGTTTGLSQSLVSLVRAFGPAAASSLFVISMRHSVLGARFFYGVLILLVLLALVASLHVPKVMTRASEEHDD